MSDKRRHRVYLSGAEKLRKQKKVQESLKSVPKLTAFYEKAGPSKPNTEKPENINDGKLFFYIILINFQLYMSYDNF